MSANAGRRAGLPKIPLSWQATLGGMLDAGVTVHACCSVCGLWRPVDVAQLAERRGRGASLWDKRSTCPTLDAAGAPCSGQVFYHAANPGNVSRPLRS